MPEKLKKRNSSVNRSSIITFVVSAVLAVIIWLVLSLTAFPEMTLSLKEVPIDFSITNSYADNSGLSIMSRSDEAANVRIKGLRYQIGEYTSEDIHIGLNLDSVRAPGKYDLALVVTSVNGDEIEVEIEPKTVNVEFDKMTTKTFSVEDGTLTADISNLTAADGYMIATDEITIEPSSVELYGPQDYIEQITSCSVSVNNAYTAIKTINTDKTSLNVYNGTTVITTDRVASEPISFTLNVPVYMVKELPLAIDIDPPFESFNLSSLDGAVRIEPESIIVKSMDDRIKKLEKLTLDGSISLKDITVGTAFAWRIPDKSYYTNISGTDQALISFDLEGYSTKKFRINNSQVRVINIEPGYRVSVETNRLNVTVVGPADVLEEIDASDIVAQIDYMEHAFTTGLNMREATIYLPQYDNCWVYGSHQIMLNVEEVAEDVNVNE